MFIMKDNKVGPAHLKIASSPSYTLAELKQLAREYTASRRDDHSLIRELTISLFVEWLAKREQGKELGDVR